MIIESEVASKLIIPSLSSCSDQELKKEGFFIKPINWLIKKQLVLPSSCSKCSQNHTDYVESRTGEFHWKCGRDCPSKPLELIPCFDLGSQSTIKVLPKVIYNWALYGHAGVLLEPGESILDSNCVRLVIESIRQVCHLINDSFACKLGVNGRKVDLFSCSCSKYFTIFAFEPETMNFRFQIVDQTNVELFVAYLIEWFDPNVHLNIYEKGLEFLKNYAQHFKTVERIPKLDTKGHQFFNSAFDLIIANMQHGCENQFLFTKFLNEVIWRHNFGQTPYSTFQHIVSILRSNQTLNYNRPSIGLAVELDSRSVILDEWYYGRLNLLTETNVNPHFELRCNILCHFCNVHFNFQTLFNHLVCTHSSSQIRKQSQNPSFCDHCFTKNQFYDFSLHRDLLEGRYRKEGLKTVKNACKICCLLFRTQKEVIKHLHDRHRLHDFPYSCELCPFRTSFYHEKIAHYKRNHQELVKAYCKYCLKIYTGENASKELYEHIQRHLEVRAKFDCNHCSLTFVDDREYKHHFLHDHILQKSKIAFNFEVITYKMEKADDDGAALKVKLPSKAPIKLRQKRLADGKQVSVEERRITKKDAFKVRYQRLEHDEISDKQYIIIADRPVTCLECCQPMDTNHLSKAKKKCPECDYNTYCYRALDYPCGLHFGSRIRSDY